MAISLEYVGRTYPATKPYRVSRAKISEFAQALGDENPAYFADEPIAPPTFAALIAAQAWEPFFADEDLDLALERTVHADQQFSYERPFKAGDDVSASLTITKVRNRASMEMITIEVDLKVDDELVCRATSQLIHNREAKS